MYSQTHLISHWRDCLYYVRLSGVDIKRSCSTEVNINIQPYVLLLYITVNINVHMQLHYFQCTSTVHVIKKCHTTSRCCVYYIAKTDCEWPGIQRKSTDRSSQGTVEIREVGHMTWYYNLLISTALWQRPWWGRHGMHRGSLTCNRQMAATRRTGMQHDTISWQLHVEC